MEFAEKDVKGLLKGNGDITNCLKKRRGMPKKNQSAVIGQNVTIKDCVNTLKTDYPYFGKI